MANEKKKRPEPPAAGKPRPKIDPPGRFNAAGVSPPGKFSGVKGSPGGVEGLRKELGLSQDVRVGALADAALARIRELQKSAAGASSTVTPMEREPTLKDV